ncbi:glucuronate isomerase [Alkalihalobacillus sp. TS-13]|uniref:glucuronate isomerase n=1 Tax=Alkalihalobacillus sp. TS-13 TaxID=2842455 RepID=UPI001C872ABF|nr:glucuronate isomerase [Alkalihalobacillus sp. TS-13]
MKTFISEDFLLTNDYAVELYHNYAKNLPIIDYHNHLPIEEINQNKSFNNLTEIWLADDHYKWRLLRADGVDERFIMGNSTVKEKYMAWVKTVQNSIGNPLYTWTHMELLRYFQIDELLNEDNAESVWNKANEMLQNENMSVRNLLLQSKVEYVATTDDPTDDLSHHSDLQNEDFAVKVAPTFRPDQALNVDTEGFITWLTKLGATVGKEIEDYSTFLSALSDRVDHFHEHGCKASDHGINLMYYERASDKELELIFKKRLNRQFLTEKEIRQFKTETLYYLGTLYHKKNWAMQLHLGPLRNNNSKMFDLLGRDSGFDSMNDQLLAEPLSKFLDSLEVNRALPKTILYCLNPKDNYILATMAGNFQDGSIPGKIQFGPAWWFNDHIHGIEEQMQILSNVGLLKHFIGMLTDSRSFLSFSRHEYFRRILCNMLGEWMHKGWIPDDKELLGSYVMDISYHNAKRYFEIQT